MTNPSRLFQQLRVEASIDFILMSGIAVRLKSGNKGTQPRRQNNKVTRSRPRLVGMRLACRNKDRRSWAGHLRSVLKAEMQFSFQHMPRFVVRVVHMQEGRPTPSPFVDTE